MSIVHDMKVNAHKNIYLEHMGKTVNDRELLVRYSEPACGTNPATGMLVIVPGYGGNMNSNIFKKMMCDLPDAYNLVVVSCDYFGNKFMANNASELSSMILNNPNIEQADLRMKISYEQMGESIEEFNDSGFMQALDVVYATLHVIYQLISEKKKINTNRIILFGSSHGAYLSHLANLICPKLYSYVLDICSYVYPVYLEGPRFFFHVESNKMICERLEHLISNNKDVQYIRKLYDLEYLYSKIVNESRIICFQGINDSMVPWREKSHFIEQIPYAEMILVTEEMVDQKLFKSTEHSLELDFLEFFRMIMPMIDATILYGNELCLDAENRIDDDLWISFENGFPVIKKINFDGTEDK